MFWSRREERNVYLAMGDGRSCIWLYARLHCCSSVCTSYLQCSVLGVSAAQAAVRPSVERRVKRWHRTHGSNPVRPNVSRSSRLKPAPLFRAGSFRRARPRRAVQIGRCGTREVLRNRAQQLFSLEARGDLCNVLPLGSSARGPSVGPCSPAGAGRHDFSICRHARRVGLVCTPNLASRERDGSHRRLTSFFLCSRYSLLSCRLSLNGFPCSSTVSDLSNARTLSRCAFELNAARCCLCCVPATAQLRAVGPATGEGSVRIRVARRSVLEAMERCILDASLQVDGLRRRVSCSGQAGGCRWRVQSAGGCRGPSYSSRKASASCSDRGRSVLEQKKTGSDGGEMVRSSSSSLPGGLRPRR